jgi:hypothetical protein
MPNLFMPTVLRPQWHTIITAALNANGTTFDGYGIVDAYATGLLTNTGGRVRVTFTPPTSGANLVVASAWVGMANTAPSFDGNQVQLLVGGSAGFTLIAGGSDVVSDGASFRLTPSGTLLVAFGITSGDIRRNLSLATTFTGYTKSGDSANAGTTAKSGYTTTASSSSIVTKIEVLN